MMGSNRQQNQTKHIIQKLGYLIVLVFCLAVVPPITAFSDEGASYQSIGTLYSGVVTGIQGQSIEIDRNRYGFHKELTVADDEGRERKLQEIRTGIKIQYHLKQGKVDQLIIRLAR